MILVCRPNLFLTVKQKIGDVAMDFKEEMRKEGGKYHFDGPTIIYCQTKKKTEDVTAVLRSELILHYFPFNIFVKKVIGIVAL